MKLFRSVTLASVVVAFATQAAAQISFFERENFEGNAVTVDKPLNDLRSYAFAEQASSVVVAGGQWEFCDEVQYRGHCVVLRPGQYASIRAIGLRGRVMSVRAVSHGPVVGDPRRPPPAVVVPPPMPAAGRVVLYEHNDFRGQTFTADRPIAELRRFGFNDRASSVEVLGDPWELCEDERFGGRCMVLRPGRYASLRAMDLNDRVSSLRMARRDVHSTEDPRYPPVPAPVAPPMVAQVTFYAHEDFQGQSFTTDHQVSNFGRHGFNDRASSVVVSGERWEVCEDAHFAGRCVILRPGNYASLRSMGLNDRASSVRPISRDARVDDYRYAPPSVASGPDFRRRPEERLYEVSVSYVRAVLGPPEQRCWVEREQIVQDQGNANVPNAIAGAIIGGILGHQIGGGTGKDVATVGGAVAGAAIGANIGRDNAPAQPGFQDVRRCERVPSQGWPQYWDVSYYFRGVEHRVQMSHPPGATLTVNDRGEPRW